MKKSLLFVMLMISFIVVSSQQVAINTDGSVSTDPKAMLEVKKNFYSKLKVRSMDYADTSVLELSNRTAANLGTDFLISARKEQGFLFSSVSDLPSNTNDSLFSILTGGNAGVGVRFPANRFQVHNGGSVNSYMNMTNSTTGVGVNDGLLMGMAGSSGILANLENGNLRLGTNNLTRIMIDAAGNVGVGNLSPVYKLDVNGDMNLTGAMRINGSAGTTGQVLTSNGTSDPEWKEAAFGNTTRFSVNFNETTLSGGLASFPLTMQYNLNPTDITIGASSITINKTGLYHFDYYFHYSGVSISPPNVTLLLFGAYPGASMHFLKNEPTAALPGSSALYKYNGHFTLDVHITAPATLSLRREYLNVSDISAGTGDFIGYLINQ